MKKILKNLLTNLKAYAIIRYKLKKGSVIMIKKESVTLIAQRKPAYMAVMKELEDLQKTLLRREEERTMLEADCHKMNKGIKFAALPKEILNDYIEKIVVDNELAIEIVWREGLDMA